MSNDKKKEVGLPAIKSLLTSERVENRFQELLGDRAPGFVSSVLEIVRSSNLLSEAEPETVMNAAATAAILNLPINKNLGFAWIVPYKNNRTGEVVAQFQIGWKGYVQLALRTSQYARINVTPVYQNQFRSWNALSEDLIADFGIEGEGEIIGYCAFFRLLNGFEKYFYWTKAKVVAHAEKYSKSYKTPYGAWTTDFDDMALKTVLKNMLSKWGILSIDLETAIAADSSIQRTAGDYKYLENANGPTTIDIEENDFNKERARILAHINKSKTLPQLQQVAGFVNEFGLDQEFEAKLDELSKAAKK